MACWDVTMFSWDRDMSHTNTDMSHTNSSPLGKWFVSVVGHANEQGFVIPALLCHHAGILCVCDRGSLVMCDSHMGVICGRAALCQPEITAAPRIAVSSKSSSALSSHLQRQLSLHFHCNSSPFFCHQPHYLVAHHNFHTTVIA